MSVHVQNRSDFVTYKSTVNESRDEEGVNVEFWLYKLSAEDSACGLWSASWASVPFPSLLHSQDSTRD
jgi:hypothetical protein